jgi:hypothetical protein
MSRKILPFFMAIVCLAPMAHAQDAEEEITELAGVMVAYGEAPPPMVGSGAPNYSPEQTASFICENQDLGVFRVLTGPIMQAAHDATLRAREVRKRAFFGEAGDAEMIEAELDRQRAVGRLGGEGRFEVTEARERDGLIISGIEYERVMENGRRVLIVTGQIENTNEAAVALPPVSMRSLDHRGFSLAGQTSQLDQIEIRSGEVLPFTLRFKNPPEYTVDVIAFVAPPFLVRNFRGCDFFDPLAFDPNESAVRRGGAGADGPAPVAIPQVGEGAPYYSAAELASMVARARLEAQTAFGVTERTACSEIPGRREWRERMVLADRLEEAWIATNAAEEFRRDAATGLVYSEEVAEAELARQAAVRAVLYANRPAQVSNIDRPRIQVLTPTFTARGGGVRVRVEVQNAGQDRLSAPLLRIQLFDRNGMTVVESFQRMDRDIRAGRVQESNFDFDLPASLIAGVQVTPAC